MAKRSSIQIHWNAICIIISIAAKRSIVSPGSIVRVAQPTCAGLSLLFPDTFMLRAITPLYVNLFAQSSSTVQLNKKLPVTISQETKYPWDGQVKISVSPEKTSRFALCLRIPGWAENQVVPSDLYSFVSPETGAVSVTVNGEPVQYKTEKGYAVIDHEWKQGDVVSYNIPMSIRRVQANAQVADDAGKVAIERGPIVYCLEGADNGADLMTLSLPDSSKLTESYNSGELSGVVTISGDAEIAKGKKTEVRKFTAIP